MARPWFFADPGEWEGTRVLLSPDETHHATRVMRVGDGARITVTDGAGTVAACVVSGVSGGRLVAEVIDVQRRERRLPAIAVYQGAPKGRKGDEVIERLAEIGVAEVRIYEGARSVARIDRTRASHHAWRWDAIARSVAKQSRNPFLTATGPVLTWAELLDRVGIEHHALVLWEDATVRLRRVLTSSPDRIALVVGPEGGIAPEEATALEATGAELVSLGPQILRTENAALVAATAILYHYDAIG